MTNKVTEGNQHRLVTTYGDHLRVCHLFGLKPKNILSFWYWKYFVRTRTKTRGEENNEQ